MEVDTENGIFTQPGLSLFDRYQQKLANGDIKNQLLDTKDDNISRTTETEKLKTSDRGVNFPSKAQNNEFNITSFESLTLVNKEKLNGFCSKLNNLTICLLNENIVKHKNF